MIQVVNIPIQNIYFLLCYAWDKLAEKDVVAVEARRLADARCPADGPPGPPPPTSPEVGGLTERRLRELPPDTRPLPSVAGYDQLLRRPGRHHSGECPDGADGANGAAGGRPR